MAESEQGQQLESFTNVALWMVLGIGIMGVVAAFAIMKKRSKSKTKMDVDDQKYVAAAMYLAQGVDILSDCAFAFQCRAYWLHLGDVPFEVRVRPEVFEMLYYVALIFVVGPYFLNLVSSVNITRKIVNDESMSEHSKQYFRAKSKVYVILVLMSGGAFPALKLMNSNLFGLGLLSAGLSTIQLQGFRGHHVMTTVCHAY